MVKHIVLEGNKIRLRVMQREDIKLIYEYYGDFRIRKYLIDKSYPIYYEEEIEWYENLVKNKQREIVFVIEEKSSGNLVGVIGLHKIDYLSRNAEIGYWLWKDYWNKGYATEAVKLMLYYAFNYLNLEKVYAKVKESNIASRRVLEKNGFKLVGKLRKHEFVPEEGLVDVVLYDILREEYIKLNKNSKK